MAFDQQVQSARTQTASRLSCRLRRFRALDVLASYDPVTKKLLCALRQQHHVGPEPDREFLSAWNIPVNNQVLLEAVSQSYYGGAGNVLWTNTSAPLAASRPPVSGNNRHGLLTVPVVLNSPCANPCRR